jgi:uncharacterized protein YggT (Ycf19 family)
MFFFAYFVVYIFAVFVAICQSEDWLQNIEQLIDNGVERNLKTVERFEIRILRVSDATDGCEWSNLMYLVIFSKFN